MVSTMSISEARAALPEVLDRVEAGEEITVTRHGKPVAVVVRPDALRNRRASAAYAAADRLGDLLAEAASTPVGTAGGISAERAEELVAEVRAGRDAR
jgi:prevent-host-death family protein